MNTYFQEYCIWCGKPCSESGFCSEDCYEMWDIERCYTQVAKAKAEKEATND